MKETDIKDVNVIGNEVEKKRYYMEDLESVPSFLNSAVELFEFDDEAKADINMITPLMANERMMKYTPKAKNRTPENCRQLPTQGKMVVHTLLPEEGIPYFMESLDKTNKYFEDIEKRYTDPKSTQRRVVNVLKNQMELVRNEPDYLDIVEQTEMNYTDTINSVFMTFPSPLFAKEENGKTVYEIDYAKHQQLMEKMGLLDILEDKQNFFLHESIPYYKAKKAGTLTLEQKADYYNKYNAHLKKQNEMYQKIAEISNDDPLVTSCYTFGTKSDIFQNNFKTRFAVLLTDNNNDTLDFLGKGWPVEDIPVLRDIKKWYKGIEKKAAMKPGDYNYDAKMVADCKKIIKDVKKAYNRIDDNIGTDEGRKKVLKDFNKYYKKYEKTKAGETISCVDSKVIDAVINRNYEYYEIGNLAEVYVSDELQDMEDARKEQEKKAKKYVKNEFGISVKEYSDILNELYEQLDEGDSWYVKSSEEFKDMKKEMARIAKESKEFANDELDMMKLGDCIDSEISMIEAYLKHKGVQLDKNAARKDSWKKSFNEQPRIKLALDLYEKLIEMSETIEKAYIEKVKEPVKESIKEQLAHEEKLRESIDSFDDKERRKIRYEDRDRAQSIATANYDKSIIKSIDMIFKSEDVFYKRMKGESFTSLRNRMNDAMDPDYTKEKLDAMSKSDGFKEMIDKVKTTYSDIEGRYTVSWSNGSLKRLYNQQIEGLAEKVRAKKQSEVRQSRKADAANMRKKLVSEKAPKKPQAPGM